MTAVFDAAASPKARTPSQHARLGRIVTAATALLDDRDYERIQVREVAEAADVALATLYRYFPSKERLYATVLVTWAESFEAGDTRRSATESTDEDRLRSALRRAVRAYERHPHFYRLITILEVVSDPEVAELFDRFAVGFGDSLRDSLRSLDADDAEVMVHLVSSLLGSLLRSWSMGKSPIALVYAEIDRAVALLFRPSQ